jgi:lipopolysaccharide/colanic/teichoic acid biosynthesis glycosyltransferase
MALIGPRPERPFFVERLATAVPFYRMRHAIQPGITGWAQVQYGYGASEEDAFIKLRYDFFYIKNQGPLLDLAILYRTVGIVLGLKGR